MRHRGVASAEIVVRIGALVCCAAFAAAVWSASASAAVLIAHPYLSSFGSFAGVQGVATDAAGDVYVFDGGASTIDKFDAAGNPVDFSATGTNEITGVSAGGESENEIAVDNSAGPTAGDIYVADGSPSAVRIFSPAGSPLGTLSPGAGIPWSGEACGVAVDPSGDVYIGTYSGNILEYTPTGNPVTNANYTSSIGGAESPCNIAVDQAGDVFSEKWSAGPVTRYEPSQFGSPAATGSIIDSKGSTLAVDPSSQEVYVDEQGQVAQFGVHGEPVGTFAATGEGAISGSFGIAVGPVNHDVYVSDGNGKLSVFGTEVVLPTPAIEETGAASITSTSATLQGDLNPRAQDTTYHFEYGTDTGYGASTPEGNAGSSAASTPVAAHLQGLTADTTYHYRLVATNSTGTTDGPDSTFTTQSVGGPLTLLDGRQWELVSPPEKYGAGIIPMRSEGAVIQAAEDGSGLVYTSVNPIEKEPEGNNAPEPTEVLARRLPGGGWSNRTMTTPNDNVHKIPIGEGTEYRLFSPNLSEAIVEPSSTKALAPGVTLPTPYLRGESACAEGKPSCYTPLLSSEDTAPGAVWGTGEEHFIDASKDLNHALIQSEPALTEGAPEGGLYEWSKGHLQLVSINESGQGVRASAGAGGHTNVRGAISNDGSRVFFCGLSSRYSSCEFEVGTALYMHDTTTDESVRLDPSTSRSREFQIADEDGSRVFFTYTEGSQSQNEHLASCEFVEVGGKLVCDRSEVAPEAVGSVLGIDPDGNTVYFVSSAALAGKAVAGKDNLYVARLEGGKWASTFIATLSAEDQLDWASLGADRAEIDHMTSRVSPDGRYLAFMSERSLTGYNNHDAVSGEPDQEVFLYDGQTGKLICASCNPTGARPDGIPYGDGLEPPLVNHQQIWRGNWIAASVPGWDQLALSTAIHQTSYLSDEGRLFFNSSDALVPQDTNGLVDVYEYEPAGTGSCTRSEGCVQLISSGTSREESVFLDASASGNDVFFITAAQLTAQDDDTAYDVYDAHVCTAAVPCGQAPVAPPPCNDGESCKPAPTPQPSIFGAPASATFSGAGNVISAAPKAATKAKPKAKPVKCKRGFAKKKNKCVKQRKTKKTKKTKKAKKVSNKRGAGR